MNTLAETIVKNLNFGNIKKGPFTTFIGVILMIFSMSFGVYAFIEMKDLSLYTTLFSVIFFSFGMIFIAAEDRKKNKCKTDE